jgi:peptide/nickel transport system substrate-binding protein
VGALAGAGLAGAFAVACGSDGKSGATQTGQQSGAGTSAQGSPQAAQAAPQPGGTLNVYLNFNPMLDPQKQSSVQQQGSAGVMSRLFRFKTGADPMTSLNREIEPSLALSAESPDAMTWVIKLRPGVTFHNIPPVNGHAFEAEDVKATFTRILDPATSSPNRGALNMIDPAQIQMPDSGTVVFKLNYPYAPFRSLLGSPSYAMIYPREVLTGAYEPAKQAIGTGPFTLESVTPDVAYVYKKNPAFFDKSMPNVDSVRVAIIVDNAQQLAQFTGRNLDEIIFTSVTDVETAQKNNPTATLLKVDNAGPNPIYFQLGDPTSPFLDIRLRRAVSMAVDREALGKAIYQGEYQSVVFVPSYVGKWALKVSELDASIGQYYKHNPAEVKKLLDAAGATNMPFKFVRLTNGPFNSVVSQTLAETVNSMLNAAGIKTTLVIQDYFKDFVGTGRGSRQGYFDKDMLCFFAAAVYNDPDEWLFSYFHSKSTSNQEHLTDPMLDAMIDKQRTLTDDNDRLKAVRDIQAYIADKAYAPSTVGTYNWVMVQPRVQNYQYCATSAKMEEGYTKLWLKG